MVRVLSVWFALLWVASMAMGQGAASRPRSVYVFNSECSNIGMTLVVNGVPVVEKADDATGTQSAILNLALQQGRNEIEVRWRPLRDRKDVPSINFVVKERVGDAGRPNSGEDRTLVSFENVLTIAQNLDGEIVTRTAIELPSFPVAALPWSTVVNAALGPSQENAIRPVVGELLKAYVEKNSAKLKEIYHAKNERLAKAMGISLREVEEQQEHFLKKLFDDPGYSVLPLAPADLKLTKVGNRNLVRATTTSGEFPLRIKLSAGMFRADVFLSYVGNAWSIVQ